MVIQHELSGLLTCKKFLDILDGAQAHKQTNKQTNKQQTIICLHPSTSFIVNFLSQISSINSLITNSQVQ